jgi:hypothetical protein
MDIIYTILLIIIMVAIGIVAYLLGRKIGIRIGKERSILAQDCLISEINQAINRGHEKLQEWLKRDEAFSCTNPICKKRKPVSEYLNTRLLHIGYQKHLKREENDKKAIEKANKEAAESVKNMPDPLSLCRICHSCTTCENRDDEFINCDDFVKDEIFDKEQL